MNERVYETLSKTIFPQLDGELRKGVHISSKQDALHTFCLENQEQLMSWYARFSIDFERTSESVFYILPGASAKGVKRRRLEEKATLIGIVLSFIKLDSKYLVSNSVKFEDITEKIHDLVPKVTFERVFGRINTPASNLRFESEARKILSQFGRYGFVQEIAKGAGEYEIYEGVMRFIEQLRGGGELQESIARLLNKGSIETATPDSGDIDNLDTDDAESVPDEEQVDYIDELAEAGGSI